MSSRAVVVSSTRNRSAALEEFLAEDGPGYRHFTLFTSARGEPTIELSALSLGELQYLGGLAHAVPKVFRQLDPLGYREAAKVESRIAHVIKLVHDEGVDKPRHLVRGDVGSGMIGRAVLERK